MAQHIQRVKQELSTIPITARVMLIDYSEVDISQCKESRLVQEAKCHGKLVSLTEVEHGTTTSLK
jgi:hypothetical protein